MDIRMRRRTISGRAASIGPGSERWTAPPNDEDAVWDGRTSPTARAILMRKLNLIFTAILLLAALRYWVAASVRHPDDPLSVIALCKSGDIEYYPMVSALSRLELGEATVYERVGTGI